MYKQLKKIYDALQDDESKMIFEKRCKFSLCENMEPIHEMVQSLIWQYRESDQMYNLLQWLKDKKKEYIVVFGAGFAGREIVETLPIYGMNVSYICDNDLSIVGENRYGKEIISIGRLNEIKDDAVVILGTNLYAKEIQRQLEEMKFPLDSIYFPYKEWWLGKERQYFDSQIMKPERREAFIDGGAYKGEDTIAFMKWCKNQYDNVYAFEPDKNNYRDALKNLSAAGIAADYIFNEGLWSKKEKLFFSENGQAASHVDRGGNSQVQMNFIDGALKGEKASFIKMDIEGCELEALKGAYHTIEKYRPKLAICVYHKPEDIFEIPLEILRHNLDYRLYLRHYSYIFTETVLYAV